MRETFISFAFGAKFTCRTDGYDRDHGRYECTIFALLLKGILFIFRCRVFFMFDLDIVGQFILKRQLVGESTSAYCPCTSYWLVT